MKSVATTLPTSPTSPATDGTPKTDRRIENAEHHDACATTPTRKKTSGAIGSTTNSPTKSPTRSPVAVSTSSAPRPVSSCKRRRLAPEDDENAAASSSPTAASGASPRRRLNYETSFRNNDRDEDDDDSDDDASEDSDVDEIYSDMDRMRNLNVLHKLRRVNHEDGDELLRTSAFARLFEHVKGRDVVAERTSQSASYPAAIDDKRPGKWKYRGSGCVKFVRCMEEGYDRGMIRQELVKNGTLEMLMCHELTSEEVVPMRSKKGKAYTWLATSDWAYRTATRTFALRFDDDMDALRWKDELERSKANNKRVRRGLDVPPEADEVAVDGVCDAFRRMNAA